MNATQLLDAIAKSSDDEAKSRLLRLQRDAREKERRRATMDAEQLLDAIAKWSDEEKTSLLRLLQEADKRVCRKAEEDAERAEVERDAKERERRQAKIAELKKEIRELDETYTNACANDDRDKVEWVDGQLAAYRRAYGDLYDVAREEIAQEDRAARGY